MRQALLERFKVKEQDQVKIDHRSLKDTVASIFEKMGVPEAPAAEGADVLTMTDLRAVETHGVSNMMRTYVGQYNQGALNPTPKVTVVPRYARDGRAGRR